MSPPPAAPGASHLSGSLLASARRLLPLAWPVLVGQVSVLAFSTVDTVLLARSGAADLAALSVGAAAYITVFIGFMGVVMALGPMVGRLVGAGEPAAAGRQVHQAVWIALALAVLGSTLLVFPAPFLWMAGAGPDVEAKVRGYLMALALSLPASLLFTIFRGFNTAASRPKAVMVLQLAGLGMKIPLSTLLVFGAPGLALPPLGATGCGLATALVMWAQAGAAWWLLRRDPFYAPFALFGRGLDRPDAVLIRRQLALGVPMGATILVEVTGFAFMAFFMARLSTTAVAGHQIAVNVVSLMFMMPLALAQATSTLVAQRIGAGDLPDATRLGWHGIGLGTGLALGVGALSWLLREPLVRLYTADPTIAAAALPLLAWVLWFHTADAAQTLCALVLRAWHVATAPFLIYAVLIWGLGLGGGWWLGFGHASRWWPVPAAWQGASGFWFAATVALTLTALALASLLGWVVRQRRAR